MARFSAATKYIRDSLMIEFKIIDSYLDQIEIIISQEKDLRNYLLEFSNQLGGRVVIFKSPNSGELTIGVGGPFGFVEFSHAVGAPPYLIATDLLGKKTNVFYEFDSGGTPTPIPGENCIPINLVMELAVFSSRIKICQRTLFGKKYRKWKSRSALIP